MLPKGFLVGNLTADPQPGLVSSTQTPYCRFSVACNEIYGKSNSSPKTHFFNCVAWGKKAEFIQKFLKKGEKVFIEYKLNTSSYSNQKGELVKTTDLMVENIESLGSRSSDQEYKSSLSKSEENVESVQEESSDDDDNITLDEIYSKN